MKSNSQSGLTLLEVLASIVIVGLIVTTFFGFFSQSMLFSSKNEEDLQAINTARRVLAYVQEANNSNIASLLATRNNKLGLKLEESSSSYYIEVQNNNKYYVQVKKLPSGPSYSLIPIAIQICDTPCKDNRENLLSETFGYIKDEANE